ncbi:unnamed protein product [Heligmosomoides polygyrus]|uniref:SCP domain-containing protein n=1 Tax=Heligmosomoides polygyrus TaxID=6339 RepID=A0A183FXW8_HELPZ|nr:unnamed protein product [Heligmosomoides polygyrus]
MEDRCRAYTRPFASQSQVTHGVKMTCAVALWQVALQARARIDPIDRVGIHARANREFHYPGSTNSTYPEYLMAQHFYEIKCMP